MAHWSDFNVKNISGDMCFDENLRIIGTAHISKKSLKPSLQRLIHGIPIFSRCESRLRALKEPEKLESETLLEIVKEGKAPMVILQSALAAEQRRMGLSTGEKPGAELLAAVNAAEEREIPVELVDRDVVITLRRAWKKMGFREKWKVLYAMLWAEDDEEMPIDELLEDSDMLSNMLEEARSIAPGAGYALIDERDIYLSEKIRQIRHKGRVLVVVGAGHVNGINENLNKEKNDSEKIINELNESPTKSKWPKIVMLLIPILIFSAVGWLAYNGEIAAIQEIAKTWLLLIWLLLD